MRTLRDSFIVCFSMYSAVPMPHITWNDKNMRYAFCFFPVIGTLIGGLLSIFLYLSQKHFTLGPVFVGMVFTLLPLFLTGGIHMDGFIDTCDAIFSHGEKEKKLEVLADPQAGAFGVIYSIAYLLALFAIWTELVVLKNLPFYFFIFPFMISRSVGGIQTIHWKSAKQSGLKYLFATESHKTPVLFVLYGWIILCVAVGVFLLPALTIVLVLGIALFLLLLKRYLYKEFGGITGDLIGFSISMTEILILLLTLLYFQISKGAL